MVVITRWRLGSRVQGLSGGYAAGMRKPPCRLRLADDFWAEAWRRWRREAVTVIIVIITTATTTITGMR